MAIIRCTQKLLKEMGLNKSELSDEVADSGRLGAWYANLLVIERKKSVIFTNERTLLSFLTIGLKRDEIRQLDHVFRQGLVELLDEEGVSVHDDAERVLGEYREIGYGRTGDRSVLGCMNDLANMAQYQVAYQGGLRFVEMPNIRTVMNEAPMSRLGMESPRRTFRRWLDGDAITSSPRKRPAARKKKPQRTFPDDVTIRLSGGTAIITPKDSTIATTHLEIGPHLASMSETDVLALFNDTIEARDRLAAQHPDIIQEIPPGRPQIRYHEQANQWTPRGSALRCVIGDAGDQAVIYIDDQELTIEEFGRLLTTYAGWGMRIEFMSEESLFHRPPLELCDPNDADEQ
jgi:hypothetical protein